MYCSVEGVVYEGKCCSGVVLCWGNGCAVVWEGLKRFTGVRHGSSVEGVGVGEVKKLCEPSPRLLLSSHTMSMSPSLKMLDIFSGS